MKVNTNLLISFIFKLVFAILNISLPLFSYRFGEEYVGQILSVMTSGVILSSLYFSFFRKPKIQVLLIYSFLGLFVSSFLCMLSSKFVLFLAAFLFSFSSNLSYLLLVIKISVKIRNKDILGHFEFSGGVGYLTGLIISSFVLHFFTIYFLFFIALILSFFLFVSSMYGNLKLSISNLVPNFRVLNFNCSKIKFHLISLVVFLTFGVITPLIVVLSKYNDLNDSAVFFLSFVSSFFSLIFYEFARNSKYRTLFHCLLVRSFMFGYLGFLTLLKGKVLLFLLLAAYSVVDGVTWGYIMVLWNSITLEMCKKEFGVNSLFRNFGFFIGNLLSSYLVTKSFILPFFLSSLIVLISSVFFNKLVLKDLKE